MTRRIWLLTIFDMSHSVYRIWYRYLSDMVHHMRNTILGDSTVYDLKFHKWGIRILITHLVHHLWNQHLPQMVHRMRRVIPGFTTAGVSHH